MEYLGNLVIIGMYLMLEIKFDEQIRAELGTIDKYKIEIGNRLIHSFWQNSGRFILIAAIIWNQPMNSEIIALWTFLMYSVFYWILFDSIYAAGVLKQMPWYLGKTSRVDKLFPKWSHFIVWILKWIALGGLIWLVIKTA